MQTRKLPRLGLVPTLLALLAAPALAQLPESSTHDRIQSRTYQFDEAGMEMGYQLYVPTSYEQATPASLIVLLHGLGSQPDRVIRYESLTELAEERGYIVVAPTGYNVRGWYGSRGTGRASNRGEAANDPDNLGELSEMDVMNVLEIALDEFNIDRDEIFLMGHSMGGGGTLHLATKYPDMWAGLGPVAPAIYTSPDALEAIRDTPVIVVMGDADELVDVEVTRRWISKMGELGIPHRYIEINGGDHSRIITTTPKNMRAIFDFFDDVRGD
jgi:poly(3-hydroxybutyrate) depolymerase